MIEEAEGFNVELDEFAEQVEAALQNLLGSQVLFYDVGGDMLQEEKPLQVCCPWSSTLNMWLKRSSTVKLTNPALTSSRPRLNRNT